MQKTKTHSISHQTPSGLPSQLSATPLCSVLHLQLLDDQIVKTQAMRASPYIGPFEERVKAWEAKLNRTQVKHSTLHVATQAVPCVPCATRAANPNHCYVRLRHHASLVSTTVTCKHI